MKKIILILVLVFGIMFGNNAFGEYMKVTPIIKNITITQGEKKVETITIENTTNKEVILEISEVDLDTLLKIPNFKEKNPENNITNDFVILDTKKIILKPNETKIIKYYIKTDQKIQPKKYFGGIAITYSKKINFPDNIGGGTYDYVIETISIFTIKVNLDLTILRSKLIKSKYKKIVLKLDNFFPKLSKNKLENIKNKIGKFSEKIRNNKKYKDILDYLEAKIKLEIIKRNIN